MFPLSAILALENPWIHVGATNNDNMAPYIKGPVNEHLSIRSTLRILYVHLYNGYIMAILDLGDILMT